MCVSEETRQELRARLGGLLPTELDTDFTLDRWLKNCESDVDRCAGRFAEYTRNRRALGFHTPDAYEKFCARSEVMRFHQVFNVTQLDTEWVNEKDNGLVFVEQGIGDPDKVLKEFSVGEYLRIFFGYCEYFQKMIVDHERTSGRRSHGVCIFDMSQMSFRNYINPYAPINQLLQARVNVWTTYYGELLKCVVIVNPPRFLGALFKMMSLMMPAHLMSRFQIAHSTPHDIEKHISRSAIPTCYGGEREIGYVKPNGEPSDGPVNMNGNGINEIKALRKKHGISTENFEEVNILGGERFVRELHVERGELLFYEYMANRELQVSITNENSDHLIPNFQLCTPLIPECEAIVLENSGKIRFEIKNLNKTKKLNVKLSIHCLEATS